jgi:hypothetical protein
VPVGQFDGGGRGTRPGQHRDHQVGRAGHRRLQRPAHLIGAPAEEFTQRTGEPGEAGDVRACLHPYQCNMFVRQRADRAATTADQA